MSGFTAINVAHAAEQEDFSDTASSDDQNDYYDAPSVQSEVPGAQTNAYGVQPAMFNRDDSGHSIVCNGRRSASTPPQSPIPAKRPSTLLAHPGALTRDQNISAAEMMHVVGKVQTSKLLVRYERLHKRAVAFLPDFPLPKGRYWIAVVDLGRKVQNVSSEKHFTWMKGNEKTTVRTVWHAYQTASMAEDFVLRLGYEPVEMTDMAVELDQFSDRFICFRAVHKGADDDDERSVWEDAVPKETTQPIAID